MHGGSVYVAGNQRRRTSRRSSTPGSGACPTPGPTGTCTQPSLTGGCRTGPRREVAARITQIADQASRVRLSRAARARFDERPRPVSKKPPTNAGTPASAHAACAPSGRPDAAEAAGLEAGHRTGAVAQGVDDGRGCSTTRRDRSGAAARRPVAPARRGRPAAGAVRHRARRSRRGGRVRRRRRRRRRDMSRWRRPGSRGPDARRGHRRAPGRGPSPARSSAERAAPRPTASATPASKVSASRSAGMPTTAPTDTISKPGPTPSDSASERPSARSSASDTAISKAAASIRSAGVLPKRGGTSAALGSRPFLATLALSRRVTPRSTARRSKSSRGGSTAVASPRAAHSPQPSTSVSAPVPASASASASRSVGRATTRT